MLSQNIKDRNKGSKKKDGKKEKEEREEGKKNYLKTSTSHTEFVVNELNIIKMLMCIVLTSFISGIVFSNCMIISNVKSSKSLFTNNYILLNDYIS